MYEPMTVDELIRADPLDLGPEDTRLVLDALREAREMTPTYDELLAERDAWRELAWSSGWALVDALQRLETARRPARDGPSMSRMESARDALKALGIDTVDPAGHPPHLE